MLTHSVLIILFTELLDHSKEQMKCWQTNGDFYRTERMCFFPIKSGTAVINHDKDAAGDMG
jgi:hypothetical protein